MKNNIRETIFNGGEVILEKTKYVFSNITNMFSIIP
jgi:hypothetical protein